MLIGTTLSSTLGNTAFAAINSRSIDQLIGRSSVSIEYPTTVIPEITRYSVQYGTKNGKQYRDYHLYGTKIHFYWYNNKLYLYNAGINKFITGLVKSGKDYYYFNVSDKDPYAKTDWLDLYGYRYHFDRSTFKAKRSDHLYKNGRSYYFDEFGHLQIGFFKRASKTYYTDNSGAIIKGFYSFKNGDRYYFNPDRDGAMTTGWHGYSNENMMHFNENGVMSRGVVKIKDYHNDGYFLFVDRKDGNAYHATGFYSDPNNGKRYLFNGPNGKAHTGWHQYEKRSYNDDAMMYFNADGSMARGVTKIGDDWYVFTRRKLNDLNEYRAYGWYSDTNTGKRYYFDRANGGKAVRGVEKVIDGKRYKFNDDGALALTYLK